MLSKADPLFGECPTNRVPERWNVVDDHRPEAAFAVLPEEQNAIHCFQDVTQVQPIIPHKGTASFSTFSLM